MTDIDKYRQGYERGKAAIEDSRGEQLSDMPEKVVKGVIGFPREARSTARTSTQALQPMKSRKGRRSIGKRIGKSPSANCLATNRMTGRAAETAAAQIS
jgi:hypothetical protein